MPTVLAITTDPTRQLGWCHALREQGLIPIAVASLGEGIAALNAAPVDAMLIHLEAEADLSLLTALSMHRELPPTVVAGVEPPPAGLRILAACAVTTDASPAHVAAQVAQLMDAALGAAVTDLPLRPTGVIKWTHQLAYGGYGYVQPVDR